MNANSIRLVIITFFYIVIFLTGYLLFRRGKPYSVLISTIHKLISVGGIVYLVLTIIKINRVSTLGGVETTICVLSGLFFLGLVVTGGLIVSGKNMPQIIHRLHYILPYLVVISTGMFIFAYTHRVLSPISP